MPFDLFSCYTKYLEQAPKNMKITLDKLMVVFNGGPKSITTIPAGTYSVEEVAPIDTEKRLIWYRFIGTKKIIGLNPEELPKGIILKP